MKQAQIIEKLENDITRHAYRAKIQEQLKTLEYDASMMEYYSNVSMGQAFEAIELLNLITNKPHHGDDVFNAAEEEAIQDVKRIMREYGYSKAGFIALLDAAGFSGVEHYAVESKYNDSLPA